jgi:endonuclease YncB( thermonuclease family)
MTLSGYVGKALLLSAFLVFTSPAQACEADRIDLSTSVSWVYDGDTVRLRDGRKLRLIGINTPETGNKKTLAEPGGEAAARRLAELIEDSGNAIRIRIGEDSHDRYGRMLGHAYNTRDQSITRILITEGHGAAVTVAPNQWNADCYYAAEEVARKHKRGIWASNSLGPIASTELPAGIRGFRIIRGRVISVKRVSNSTWLNLQGKIGLRIDHDDQPYFEEMDLRSLNQRVIEARGWIYQYKGQPRMHISSPRSIRILQTADLSD